VEHMAGQHYVICLSAPDGYTGGPPVLGQ